MTADQLAAWRRELAARAKAARRQRGKHRTPAIKPGMIRRPPPDDPAPGGAAPKE